MIDVLDLLSSALLVVLAFFASVVGALVGAGGGFVFTPILILMGYPPKEAVSTSLVMVLFNSLSASISHYRIGRLNVGKTLLLGVGTLPGTIAGYFILSSLNLIMFRLFFSLFILIVSTYLLLKTILSEEEHDKASSDKPDLIKAYLLAPVVGMLASLFGIGGGVLMVPTLIYLAVPTHTATAMSMFVNMFSSSFALLSLSSNNPPALTTLVLMAFSGVAGGQVGVIVNRRLSGRTLRAVIAGVFMVMGVSLLSRNG
ncbi:MAG: sulfite exporter TauE/SafE family protein [Candidatus Caldarchaeum sp.]